MSVSLDYRCRWSGASHVLRAFTPLFAGSNSQSGHAITEAWGEQCSMGTKPGLVCNLVHVYICTMQVVRAMFICHFCEYNVVLIITSQVSCVTGSPRHSLSSTLGSTYTLPCDNNFANFARQKGTFLLQLSFTRSTLFVFLLLPLLANNTCTLSVVNECQSLHLEVEPNLVGYKA